MAILPNNVEEGLDRMKGQLLLLLVEKLGGDITIPVSEIDDTGGKILMMESDHGNRTFRFVVKRKQ